MSTKNDPHMYKPTAVDPSERRASPFAYRLARDGHENQFSSRRIIGDVGDANTSTGFYIIDNNPFHDVAARPAVYARVVAAMEARGCKVMERAHYPAKGDEAGYTLAIVFKSADPSRVDDDVDAARAALRAALAMFV